MRLIGSFETEKQAFALYTTLLKEGIENSYEPYLDEKSGKTLFRIWIVNEDDLDRAIPLLTLYQEHPEDPRFQQGLPPPAPRIEPQEEGEEEDRSKWKAFAPIPLKRSAALFPLTYLVIFLCAVVFMWDGFEEAKIVQEQGVLGELIGMTPLERTLLFDDPKAHDYIDELVATVPLKDYKDFKDLPANAQELIKKAETTPAWKGIYPFLLSIKQLGWTVASQVPMFEKIREGQYWRLITPAILHRDFLHILFNMIWAWILIKQMEQRLHRWKIILFMGIVALVSNVGQYLVGGPYFLGFSGVVVGMAGFIWMRQKVAPWEGYPLQKATILFLLFFVLAMVGLEIVTFSLHLMSVLDMMPTIANTAHIVGGLSGMVLGRLSFFNRRLS